MVQGEPFTEQRSGEKGGPEIAPKMGVTPDEPRLSDARRPAAKYGMSTLLRVHHSTSNYRDEPAWSTPTGRSPESTKRSMIKLARCGYILGPEEHTGSRLQNWLFAKDSIFIIAVEDAL